MLQDMEMSRSQRIAYEAESEVPCVLQPIEFDSSADGGYMSLSIYEVTGRKDWMRGHARELRSKELKVRLRRRKEEGVYLRSLPVRVRDSCAVCDSSKKRKEKKRKEKKRKEKKRNISILSCVCSLWPKAKE